MIPSSAMDWITLAFLSVVVILLILAWLGRNP